MYAVELVSCCNVCIKRDMEGSSAAYADEGASRKKTNKQLPSYMTWYLGEGA